MEASIWGMVLPITSLGRVFGVWHSCFTRRVQARLRTDGWAGRRTDSRMHARTDGWVEGGRTGGRMHGRTDMWTLGCFARGGSMGRAASILRWSHRPPSLRKTAARGAFRSTADAGRFWPCKNIGAVGRGANGSAGEPALVEARGGHAGRAVRLRFCDGATEPGVQDLERRTPGGGVRYRLLGIGHCGRVVLTGPPCGARHHHIRP